MVGLVVVSHSRALAQAAVALALEMVPAPDQPEVAIAAGLDETTFGTDAAAVAEAISVADSPDGVLVLLDLGSAVLSAEMALEFVDPEVAARVRLTAAPLVEGLVAAVVTAATGADLDTVAAEASAGLVGKQSHLGTPDAEPSVGAAPVDADGVECRPDPDGVEYRPDPDGVEYRTVIRNPHGLHARPAAYLVSGLRGLNASVLIANDAHPGRTAPASSPTRIATLGLVQGATMVAFISGPDTDAAVAKLTDMSERSFGEDLSQPADVTPRDPGTADDPAAAEAETAQAGTGVQIVIGPVLRVDQQVDTLSYQPSSAEWPRFTAARDRVVADLQATSSGPQSEIFAAQAIMLDDPEVSRAVHDRIEEGASAVEAIRDEFGALADAYDALSDPYLRERAQDVRSLERQLLLRLMGQDPQVKAPDQPSVWVFDELDAASAAGLDPATCLGVVTLTGGATGHGVIVATGRGFPVLTGRAEFASLPNDTLVAFDPRTRQEWIDPDPTTLAELGERAGQREAEHRAAQARATEPAITRAGQHVLVEANVASLADAQRGAANGADGSGLVRTELLFETWTTAPTAAEQADIFLRIGQALQPHPITIRTWDVGGDKPLAFLPQAPELNPFLGERGLRTMRRVPELFDTQLRAIVMASAQTPIRVMFPMVTNPEEMNWARARVNDVVAELGADPIPIGMMVEVPAAAVRARDFATLVDFVSIGTNDLTQYVTASDRTNAAVSELADSHHRAIWDLIAATCESLGEVPVAVCGDLASDVDAASSLVALGVRELSVRPALVSLIKQAVRVG